MITIARCFGWSVCIFVLAWSSMTLPRPVIYTPTVIRPAIIHSTVPITASRRSPVKHVKAPKDSVICLAQTLYFEANNEPDMGIQAVAATVFNRATHSLWPSTICGVVYQRAQFSWTADVSNWTRRPPQKFIEMAKTFIADKSLIQEMFPVTHFHHVNVAPKWAAQLTYTGTYGQHHFYRRE